MAFRDPYMHSVVFPGLGGHSMDLCEQLCLSWTMVIKVKGQSCDSVHTVVTLHHSLIKPVRVKGH